MSEWISVSGALDEFGTNSSNSVRLEKTPLLYYKTVK